MKHNRIAKLSSKRAKFWCIACDMALVAVGQKCPMCGVRDKTKHKRRG